MVNRLYCLKFAHINLNPSRIIFGALRLDSAALPQGESNFLLNNKDLAHYFVAYLDMLVNSQLR